MKITVDVTQEDIARGEGGNPFKCMVALAVKRHTAPGVSVAVGVPSNLKVDGAPMMMQPLHVCLRDISPGSPGADPQAPVGPEEMCALPPEVQNRIRAFDAWWDRRLPVYASYTDAALGGPPPKTPEPFSFELEVPAVYLGMTVPVFAQEEEEKKEEDVVHA